eukprot:COSAG06_NODE_755_length_12532_cov_10.124990_2_plen_163_part_00
MQPDFGSRGAARPLSAVLRRCWAAPRGGPADSLLPARVRPQLRWLSLCAGAALVVLRQCCSSAARFVTLSDAQRASQSVRDWRFKTSLRVTLRERHKACSVRRCCSGAAAGAAQFAGAALVLQSGCSGAASARRRDASAPLAAIAAITQFARTQNQLSKLFE